METKIALVTGGSRGLGKDMALSIAKKGIDIILTYRTNESEANNTVKEIESLGQKAAAIRLDMSEFTSLDNFCKGSIEQTSINMVYNEPGFSGEQCRDGRHGSFP